VNPNLIQSVLSLSQRNTQSHRHCRSPLSGHKVLARRRSMAGPFIISGFRTSRHLRCPTPSSYSRLNSLLRSLHTSHPARSPLHRHRKMVEMTRRRIHGDSPDKGKSPASAAEECERHDHALSNSHSHSLGIFGGHPHSHDHDHGHGGELIESLQGGGMHRQSPL
jgi:hypothetical protein